jgi:hypothetical protein
MAAKDLTGTIRKVNLNGVTYDAAADASIKGVPTGHENSAVPTSGRTMRKMVKRVQSREVELVANGAEQEALKALADQLPDFPMSYETAAGDIYRAVGFLEYSNHETDENKASVTLFPRGDWEAFLG